MQNLIRRRIFRQLVKYGLIGVVSTLIDWSVYFLLTRLLNVHYLPAKSLSFSSAVFNSYIWNRRWTFRSKDPRRAQQFTKFMVVAIIGLGINTLVMYIVVGRFKLGDIYGLIFATIIATFWNFLMNKFWTFREAAS